MRKYPEPSDYQIAIQNPQLVLRDSILNTARVRVDRLGMPVVSSGGFAFSFYLQAEDDSQWVVRCFKTDSPDRRARYDAISRFLNAHPDPILLDVDYVEEGILVNGAWYPIVKMPLVRGVTLQRAIEAEITAGSSVTHLSDKFRTLVDRLQQLKIAHGDLQHGNIMVQHGELVLVDYDGMYVPALRGWAAAEMGSASYQHPLRQTQFSPVLDRFSAIVIDIALQALAAAPGLWGKYNTGENILFSKTDFSEPEASPLLHDLEKIPHLREAVHRLRIICRGPFDGIPKLEDVLPPLPDGVQPMTLPGVPQLVTSPFNWDTGNGGAGPGDVDAQLTRLYTNWTPTIPGTNWSATGTPFAMPYYATLGVYQPKSVVPGPLTPPTPLASPSPKPAAKPAAKRTAAAAPGHTETLHAPSHSAHGKPTSRRHGRAARIIFIIVAISWVLPGVMSYARTLSHIPPFGARWEYIAPLPSTYPVIAAQNAPVSPLPAVACPIDGEVYLEAPHDTVQGSVATFSWLGSAQLPEGCQYRLKLWRADGRLIALSATAASHVTATPDGYTAAIDMTKDFPPGQQFGGDFLWAVELVDAFHGNTLLPLHGRPRAFRWVPQ